eukprot:4379373-Amphidinium_carterae.1
MGSWTRQHRDNRIDVVAINMLLCYTSFGQVEPKEAVPAPCLSRHALTLREWVVDMAYHADTLCVESGRETALVALAQA